LKPSLMSVIKEAFFIFYINKNIISYKKETT